MNLDAFNATNLWWKENKSRDPHHFIVRLLPFLFDTLDALYFVTRSLPLQPMVGGMTGIQLTSPYSLTIGISLEPKDHVTLRSTLSLTGDIYNISYVLIKNKHLLELEKPLNDLFNVANKFRNARDFFTHIEQMMTDMKGNGISGPVASKSNLRYTNTAKSCVHLIWHDNKMYYTKGTKDLQTRIDREAFNPIFEQAEKIYEIITSHKINSQNMNYRQVKRSLSKRSGLIIHDANTDSKGKYKTSVPEIQCGAGVIHIQSHFAGNTVTKPSDSRVLGMNIPNCSVKSRLSNSPTTKVLSSMPTHNNETENSRSVR